MNLWKFVLLLVSSMAIAAPAWARHRLVVRTESGKIRGLASADGQVRTFLGIPYAAPPVGTLRWKPPLAAGKWKGVRSAGQFGDRCMQAALFPDMTFRDPGGSEDCLTLNVWTPAKKSGKKLPVMVWIYGGGFTTGGTSEPRQDGERLAHKGVLVVSMNYRLGIFGFFSLPALAAESAFHASGNYGLMDQAAALRWVQRNIAAFGGDPKNVTVFGESAGSMSVSAQMASPGSQGLFARAIGESGGAFRPDRRGFPIRAVSERRGAEFAQSAFASSNLATLRAIPAADLLKAANDGPKAKRPVFGPNIDGVFLPETPAAIYSSGKQAHIPLLAGWNKDEGAWAVLDAPEKPSLLSLKKLATEKFGPQSEEFLKVYGASSDSDAARVTEDFAGDLFIAYSTWAWIEAQVKTGESPVFRYYFQRDSPGDPKHPASLGAFHSDDIEYVFGNLDSRKGAKWQPEDYRLSELMQTYWTNFAKTSNPNGPGLPEWPSYNPAGQWQVMHLDATSNARPDKHRDRYLFLQKVWGN